VPAGCGSSIPVIGKGESSDYPPGAGMIGYDYATIAYSG
jgi:hypothetical protein